MSVMAAGMLPPQEAIEYVVQQPNVQSIIFGASSKKHIEEVQQIIENEYTNKVKTTKML
jgi:aryl-alcohol dehydrogenase-like predicted oxidoreductase